MSLNHLIKIIKKYFLFIIILSLLITSSVYYFYLNSKNLNTEFKNQGIEIVKLKDIVNE